MDYSVKTAADRAVSCSYMHFEYYALLENLLIILVQSVAFQMPLLNHHSNEREPLRAKNMEHSL